MGLGHSIEWVGESLADKKTVKEAFMIALGYIAVKGVYLSWTAEKPVVEGRQ